MEKIETVHVLKLNFLEVWKTISEEETQTLISYTNTTAIENKIKNTLHTSFSLGKSHFNFSFVCFYCLLIS